MSEWRLTAPALLAHVFLRRGDDTLTAARRLASAWDAVTGRLGLDGAIDGLGVPRRVPRGQPITAERSGLIAAAESGERSVWQGCAWAGHGVLAVSVMMAPPRGRDCRRQWADLERGWEQALAAGPAEGMLGEVRIFLALLTAGDTAGPGDTSGADDTSGPDDTAGRAAQATAAELVRAAVPEPSAAGWWRRRDAIRLASPDGDPASTEGDPSSTEGAATAGAATDAAVVWEIGPDAGDGRSRRRLACVAPERAERPADRLLWTAGDGTPSPFTRHLAHAAALRYQVSVYDGGAPARRLRDEIGRLVDDLSATSARAADLAGPLLAARAAAVALRTRLVAMRHAARILDQNLRDALPDPAGPDPAGAAASGPLADDRDLAAWFARRLADEISLVDEATASAAAAAALLADPGRAEGGVSLGGAAGGTGHGGAGHDPMAPPAAAAVLPGPGSPGFAARDRAAQAPLACVARHATPARTAVIFTALGVEYRAIRAYLGGAERREEHGMLYEVGTLPGIRGSWQLALAETGPGSTAAGLQLDRAVRVFDPEIAIYLGVAGGRKDVAHGDVVVADAVYDYEPGKSTLEGFEPRMRTHFPAHRLLQWARLVAREKQWQRRILPACPDPPPACHVKPIVTGAKVIAHDRSQAALLLRQYAGDAVAVETEGHGFLEAAYVNPRVDALVIRGISDLLAGKDKQGDDYWQPAASSHAAAFAVEFLDSIGGKEA